MGDLAASYLLTADKDFTHFEPNIPQYKELQNGEIVSLKLKITDQSNTITNGLRTTVVLHVQ